MAQDEVSVIIILNSKHLFNVDEHDSIKSSATITYLSVCHDVMTVKRIVFFSDNFPACIKKSV